jgi:hypothetical protein
MNSLQALVTGMIAGSLAGDDRDQLVDIDVEIAMDASGNYLPEVKVTGRQSGTVLRVSVEVEVYGKGESP